MLLVQQQIGLTCCQQATNWSDMLLLYKHSRAVQIGALYREPTVNIHAR